ncbi:hypothetical protein LPW11_13325 [Geomonas sp. RF6]|uniref:bacteriohemerythrin n=1 Tax=Geomonas sp. RF6 TaxID=2897342 RepID=UPI001E382414|nr:hemerythrin domain-containing protein [Geomonas sp. RF6]UFS68877.1 hypothetical protein LPW11_13325 [Geomonas sp. RF6]
MPEFQWDMTYVLGIEELDVQNKLLRDLVKKYFDDFKRSDITVPSLKSTLRVLLAHVGFQFDFEELCMKQTQYVNSEEHKKEHEHFRTMVYELLGLPEERVKQALDQTMRLNNWVQYHMLKSDARFAQYILSSNRQSDRIFQCDSTVRQLIQKYLRE